MLHQGNGNDLVDGVYERERLRRMAKKLGLRLVKTQVQPHEEGSYTAAPRPETRLAVSTIDANAGDDSIQETEFEKCG